VDTQPNANLHIHNAINNITSCHIRIQYVYYFIISWKLINW
jgi:hypothetical protein